MKGMAWDPTDRFSTAKEMVNAFEGRYETGLKKEPRLEVFGQKIPIKTSRLRFGRMVTSSLETQSEVQENNFKVPKERVNIFVEGDVINVYVYDPYNWISRNHFEIFEEKGKWFFKDLGSLNRSAVLTKGKLQEVWAGYSGSDLTIFHKGSI